MAEPTAAPSNNGFLRCPSCGWRLAARVHHDGAAHIVRTITNLALVAHVVTLDVKCSHCGAVVDVRMGDLLAAH